MLQGIIACSRNNKYMNFFNEKIIFFLENLVCNIIINLINFGIKCCQKM
jgi:hypothetical protein